MSTPASRDDRTLALLAQRAPLWLAAVARRWSRRAFDGRRVDPEVLATLAESCTSFLPYPDARVVLVTDPALDVFTGIIGSYGKVTGAPHLLVFIADKTCPYADQHIGFVGEAIVLEATHLGLDTCWIAGFFSASRVAKVVELAPNERVYSVSPVGYATATTTSGEKTMRGMVKAKQRKCVEELAPGIGADWPQWAMAAVETARLAPSATNRQPWRFRLEGGGLVVAKDGDFETPKVTKRLDCGISMLHVELGAIAQHAPGRWTDLDGRDVARFDPQGAEH